MSEIGAAEIAAPKAAGAGKGAGKARGRPASSAGAENDDWGTDNTPRKGDAANHKRDLANHDRKMSTAYESGRSGMPADPDFSDDELAAHASGAEEAAQPAASAPVGASSSPGPRPLGNVPNQVASAVGSKAGQLKSQGAPLLLGMVGYCIAVNWFRYGWPGVTGWFTAKFENKVTLNAPTATGFANAPQAGKQTTTVAPNGQVTQNNPDSANGAATQPIGTLS